MNINHVSQIALELNVLPDEERDQVGSAMKRIVGFIDQIGLRADETTIRELTMPLDIGGGRRERHPDFMTMLKRCGVRRYRIAVENPNYRTIPK